MVRVEWFSESETNIMNKTAAFCSQIDTDKRVKLALVIVREVYNEPGFAAWSSEYLRSRRRGVGPAQTAWASIIPKVSGRGRNPGYDYKYQAAAAAKSASRFLKCRNTASGGSPSRFTRSRGPTPSRPTSANRRAAASTRACLDTSMPFPPVIIDHGSQRLF